MMPVFADFLFSAGFVSDISRQRLRRKYIQLIKDSLSGKEIKETIVRTFIVRSVRLCYMCVCVCVCVCVILFLLSLFVSLYIFLHLTARYSSTFGKGWVGRGCLHFWYECPLVVFSLRELTCMHCVYLVL